jgi:PII-like signaling protein
MSMQIKRLRVYTDDSAYVGNHKLHELIATRARAMRMAGGTVFEAIIGFGHTPQRRRRAVLDDVQSIVIEIVDEERMLRAFVDSLSDLEGLGPITIEAVEVLRWPAGATLDGLGGKV